MSKLWKLFSNFRLGLYADIGSLGPWGPFFRGGYVRSKTGALVTLQAGGMDLVMGTISILPIKD